MDYISQARSLVSRTAPILFELVRSFSVLFRRSAVRSMSCKGLLILLFSTAKSRFWLVDALFDQNGLVMLWKISLSDDVWGRRI